MMNKYVKAKYYIQGTDEYAGKAYSFINSCEDIQKGDLVVVETRNAYQVVKVVGFTNQEQEHDITKHVIQKLDFDKFEKERERKEELMELEAAIVERAEKVRKMKELEALATDDDVLKDLIEKMKRLGD